MKRILAFSHVIVPIMWGLVALFCVVGLVSNIQLAVTAGIVVATLWALSKMLKEGVDALVVLLAMIKSDKS
jgi:hypothetical protein